MARLGGHVAANAVTLSGLECSTGLVPKGYLYTDRPAYRPGPDGPGARHHPPRQGRRVRRARGRAVPGQRDRRPRPAGLGDDAQAVGVRHVRRDGRTERGRRAGRRTPSPPAASGGRQPPVPPPALTFSGQFLVQQYQLEKMRLKLQTDRTVYFRGETVQLEIAAEYYWGQPVSGKSVRYRLPDGTSFAQPTDAQGKLKVTFDTTPLTPGSVLRFAAEIEGENVKATAAARLAVLGYGIGVRTSEPVVLSGQPFDVTLKTTGPDGKPLAAELNLTVLRRQVVKPDPVLSGVPWVELPAQAAGEVTVLERQAATDAATGEADGAADAGTGRRVRAARHRQGPLRAGRHRRGPGHDLGRRRPGQAAVLRRHARR